MNLIFNIKIKYNFIYDILDIYQSIVNLTLYLIALIKLKKGLMIITVLCYSMHLIKAYYAFNQIKTNWIAQFFILEKIYNV